MSFEYSSVIGGKIVSYLEGWKIEISSDEDSTDEEFSFLTEGEIEDLNVVKIVSPFEVEVHFLKALNQCQSYLGISFENITLQEKQIILDNICMYAAGLLWKKYNVKPVESVDETPFTGYGDDLIYKAKKSLQPYRYRKLVIF